ncbi:MAG: TonB-dependent receptor [Gillisia sp.]
MKQIIIKNMLFVCAFLLIGMAQAQTVSGTVSDPNGPLPGANVAVKGTNIGAISDFDGQYTLENVPSDAVLVFSFVGFITQEVPVNGRATVNVTLNEDASSLDEVVVIGYGTQSLRDATGAVSVVNADQFNKGVISSPEQLIQGKSAGVQITQSSGEPGAGMQVRIRGTASVRSNNNPLFVVDGVPLSGEDTSAGGADIGAGSSSARNPLNFLNPNDIESISILKDASATAIYGSRGANGVVIITTKSGRAGAGGSFEFSSDVSYSTPAERFNLLNRDEYLSAVGQYGGDVNALDFGSNTDWQDVVLRNTFSHNQSLAYSQNYGSGNVRASFSYGDQLGIVENSEQERITGRLNLTQRFFDDKLKMDFNGTISRVNDLAPLISNNSGSTGDLLGAAYFANPTWPNDVNFTTGGGGELIPSQVLAYYKDLAHTNRYLANISGEYAILPNLKAKATLGYDESNSEKSQSLSGLITGVTNGTPGNGRGSFGELYTKNTLFDLTLNYTKEFENSNFEALIGYSYQSFLRKGKTVSGFGYNTTNLDDMASQLINSSNIIENGITGAYQQYGYDADGLFVNRLFPEFATDQLTAPGNVPVRSVSGDLFNFTDELQSFFGRLNYTIADKYLFTATLRVDGSSRFGPNNSYGYFPSGAFAWKLDQEDFLASSDNISTLKLRLGYGITGSQDGLGYGNFTFRERYSGIGIDNGGNINVPGTQVVAFPNPDLKWEETSQANFGIDFGFIADRLNGSLDLYYKNTTDLLLRKEVAQPTPQDFAFENLDASVVNKGVEFSLNYDIIQSQDLNWNFGFNIAYNENEVKDFDGLIQTGAINGNGLTNAYAQLLAGGRPLFSYYLREFGGFDADGFTTYPEGDVQKFVGKSALPTYNAGFSTYLSYGNFDFNAFLAGQFGQYVYNNTANAFFTAGIIGVGKNVTKDVITSGESPANAADVSTRFLEKADFVRLQNVSVGYNVPLREDGFVNSFRLSLTGQNLFVITNYSGLDPEVNVPKSLNDIPSLGIDYTTYPRPRTITLGLNATF